MVRPNPSDDVEVRARKYGEVVVNTFSQVASVLQYPKGGVKMCLNSKQEMLCIFSNGLNCVSDLTILQN